MARGQQKIQAQQKAQKLAASKQGGKSQLAARAAGIKMACPTCKSPLPNYKMLQAHMGAKHPKDPVPSEESFSA
ncbi:MAG: putative zinc finger protein [Piptocephalis tieghemiana]|nr:MAG: putative zinc finger protein [Piptocephalis tieghemiana]